MSQFLLPKGDDGRSGHTGDDRQEDNDGAA